MKCLIATLVENYNEEAPFRFEKLDIKDVFWRIVVSNTYAWNYCYVLPQFCDAKYIEDIKLVVPDCFQMGLCESPSFFCAASETSSDVINMIL